MVEVELGEREARLHVSGLQVTDYFTLANSFADGALLGEMAAKVSFDVHWSGGGRATKIGDGTNFEAEVIQDTATIRWHAEEKGFRFRSATSMTNFAELGTERNGVFL